MDSQMRKSIAAFSYSAPSSRSASAQPGISRHASAVSRSSSSLSPTGSAVDMTQTTVPTDMGQEAMSHIASTKAPTGPVSGFEEGFSDRDLGKINRCVCCELQWTARKTGTEKRKHIKACSKKSKFDEDTVLVLLRQELQRAPPSRKGEGKAQVDEEDTDIPRTVMDVVTETALKKKGRRIEVQTTVVKPQAVGDLARGRFRDIIDPSNVARDTRTTKLDLKHTEMPPPTQTFSNSKLALGSRTARSSLFADDSSPPPSTQPMSKSKLGSARSSGFGGSLFLSESVATVQASTEPQASAATKDDCSKRDKAPSSKMPPLDPPSAPSGFGSSLVAKLLGFDNSAPQNRMSKQVVASSSVSSKSSSER